MNNYDSYERVFCIVNVILCLRYIFMLTISGIIIIVIIKPIIYFEKYFCAQKIVFITGQVRPCSTYHTIMKLFITPEGTTLSNVKFALKYYWVSPKLILTFIACDFFQKKHKKGDGRQKYLCHDGIKKTKSILLLVHMKLFLIVDF